MEFFEYYLKEEISTGSTAVGCHFVSDNSFEISKTIRHDKPDY